MKVVIVLLFFAFLASVNSYNYKRHAGVLGNEQEDSLARSASLGRVLVYSKAGVVRTLWDHVYSVEEQHEVYRGFGRYSVLRRNQTTAGNRKPRCDYVVNCFVSPCLFNQCDSVPGAVCVEDYTCGCNAIWYLDGEDVTKKCAIA